MYSYLDQFYLNPKIANLELFYGLVDVTLLFKS